MSSVTYVWHLPTCQTYGSSVITLAPLCLQTACPSITLLVIVSVISSLPHYLQNFSLHFGSSTALIGGKAGACSFYTHIQALQLIAAEHTSSFEVAYRMLLFFSQTPRRLSRPIERCIVKLESCVIRRYSASKIVCFWPLLQRGSISLSGHDCHNNKGPLFPDLFGYMLLFVRNMINN